MISFSFPSPNPLTAIRLVGTKYLPTYEQGRNSLPIAFGAQPSCRPSSSSPSSTPPLRPISFLLSEILLPAIGEPPSYHRHPKRKPPGLQETHLGRGGILSHQGSRCMWPAFEKCHPRSGTEFDLVSTLELSACSVSSAEPFVTSATATPSGPWSSSPNWTTCASSSGCCVCRPLLCLSCRFFSLLSSFF